MDPVPVFLNDASYPLLGEVGEVEGAIREFLRTLRELKGVSRGVTIGSEQILEHVAIDNEHRTLAGYPQVVDHEWWRFLRSLDHVSPCAAIAHAAHPPEASHCLAPYDLSAAPIWVVANESFCISFALMGVFSGDSFPVQHCVCVDGMHVANHKDIPNFSRVEHVGRWAKELNEYQLEASTSSKIYVCDDYFLRMYLHDHDPPHVHVFTHDRPNRWVARVRIDHPEVMDDFGMTCSLRRDVLALVGQKSTVLLIGWANARAGQLPVLIND